MIEITREEKIKTLATSAKAVIAMIPLLFVFLFVYVYFGFSMPLPLLSIILLLSWGAAFLQFYLVKKNWLIDLSYGGLFTLIIITLIGLGIHFSGCAASPFVWVAIFVAGFNTLNYGFRRGIFVSLFFLSCLWTMTLLRMYKMVSYPLIIPGFDPYLFPNLIISILSGYTMLFLLGPTAISFLSEQLRKEKRHAVELAADKEKSYRTSLSVMEDLDSAKKQLEARLAEIEDSRRATLHLLQDVAQSREESQKRAEEIAKLYEDLKLVDRMKTEFLSVISHELRTPLTPIKGYASMLISEQIGKLTPEQRRAVTVIKKEGDHLLGLIDSILDVSRMAHGKSLELEKEPVSIKNLLDELIEVMRIQSEAREIKILTEIPEDFPTLLADATKVRRLLTNLIGNSLKFTPQGGLIKIVGIKEDDTARVQVIDNGVGIAKENLEKIFDKFYQVDSSYTRAAGGVGLGLAIAKEIVETHGGKIWVESGGVGKGSKFCFTLPVGG
ncbi:MAG: HAMP domain-containing sensor histidine kinase [Candidatus Margulisiibacteriota bacterium]